MVLTFLFGKWMILFLKSLGFRVAKVMTKEYDKPHGDEDAWSESTAKGYEANARA